MNGLHLSARIFPILQDETFSSYLHNMLILAGGEEARTLIERVRFDVRRTSPLLPSRLETIRAAIGGALPSTQQLIKQNTILPTLKLTLPTADYEEVHRHTALSPVSAVAMKAGLSCKVQRRYGSQASELFWSVGICPACLRDDENVQRRAFVRRAWMFSRLAACSKHKAPLLTTCLNCRRQDMPADTFEALSMFCRCGGSLVTRMDVGNDSVAGTEIRVSEALSAFFDCSDELSLDARHTQFVLRRKAETLGLVTDSFVRKKRLEELLHQRLDPGVLKRHRLEVHTIALPDFLRGKRPLRNPIHNAVLTAALYDSLEEFKSEMHDAQTFTAEKLIATTEKQVRKPESVVNDELVGRHMRKLRSFFEQHPDATRKQARISVAHSINTLNRFIPDIVEEILPARQKSCRNLARVREEIARRDAFFADEIRRRRAEFNRNPPPFKITQARLIDGLKNHRSIFVYPQEMPFTLAAIKECKETSQQYMMRKKMSWVSGQSMCQREVLD
ncbi:TniQ family protein [Paraburkholderia bryophila]|uniref:TniQ domain-containing protein n=1 Tax=Paraburkholderia bryophila TaxID=420952 RepID=A0A7Y9WTI4_9BURK|nr:TniQ family protein [Paraburkholderia bryophila]NYH26010.1 hypothetical protein [Paraburkholderia bryophila]